jgi:hypothetical protein
MFVLSVFFVYNNYIIINKNDKSKFEIYDSALLAMTQSSGVFK